MNKLLFSSFLMAGIAFAQDVADPFATFSEPAPAPTITAPAEAPTSTLSPTPSGNSPFDMLRGHAYNPYSTLGASDNIYDLVTTPDLIHGKKFAYISPTDKIGFAAFDLMGGSVLFGLDNSEAEFLGQNLGETGSFLLGYANSGFGAVIEFALNKKWETINQGKKDITTLSTNPGDKIAAYFSMPFGIYANASWLTAMSSSNDDESRDISQIDFKAGFSAGETFVWDLHLDASRFGLTGTDDDDKTYTSAGSYLLGSLNFDVGFRAVDTPTGRIQIGSNNGFGVILLDETTKKPKIESDNVIFVRISPNILGDVALTENLLAFAGASQNLWFRTGDGDRDDDTSLSSLQQTGTQAFGGLRYQRTNWAVEAEIERNLFGVMAGNNVTGSLGGFVYF